MRRWSRCLGGVVVVAGLLLPAAGAGAQTATATLELKRVDPSVRPGAEEMPVEHLFRMTRPQTVFQQLGGRAGVVMRSDEGDTPSFAEVIRKEPAEYASATPFRGVVQLGSHHYGFVLDIAPPEKEEAEEEQPAEEQEAPRGGLFSALGRALSAPLAGQPQPEGQGAPFARLYFDLNRNGDLTDDGVIEAESAQAFGAATRSTFPVVELTLEVDGKEVDYAFVLSVRSSVSDDFSYAQASFNAAAYREGEILLDGEKRRVVLVDFDSNGRFDDAFRVEASPRRGGALFPVVGDMLYIDPQPAARFRSPFDPTTSPDQFQVSELIAYGGRFYELEIGGGGTTLSLTPSTRPVGHAANPNPGARAIVYNDAGVLEIACDDEGKAMLPEGTWRLLSYTLLHAEAAAPEAEDGPADQLAMGRPTVASARAGADFRPFRIAGGKTTNVAFGPPFTPQVTASPSQRADGTLSLQMSLVGAGGEVCTSMIIDGRRPPQPEFTIYTTDGEEVASGKFSYG